MKKLLKSILIKIFHPLAIKLGYIRAKNDKNKLLDNFYNILKQMDLKVNHIVDIGANHGTWTREALLHFPNAHYTMIEPQEWLKPSFQDLLDNNAKISFHAVGAGKEEGSFKFTIADRDDSCTFKYTKEEAEKMNLKQIEIPVVTLNSLLKNSNKPTPNIVKIDAEGLDIEVLEGASDLIGKTEVFMVEAGVVNKAFANSVLDVVSYMDNKGYRLFEITDLNRPFNPKVLWLTELVFIKKDGIIDSYQII
ncbi:MAG: FkbM family methyltransferase [Bacteroidetes bacterium RIFCSPLOWO2_12_FULL_31_6]|nr:MAG: FkbM family methyltransferase [Bacteroidetes bacterium RIFCSPLOWO2_12_FULL_31_6]